MGANRVERSYDSVYFKQGGNSFGANAALGTNDNRILTFKTNNTERMRLDADGSLLIGTTDSSAYGGTATLSVEGFCMLGGPDGIRITGGDPYLNDIYRGGPFGVVAQGANANLNLSALGADSALVLTGNRVVTAYIEGQENYFQIENDGSGSAKTQIGDWQNLLSGAYLSLYPQGEFRINGGDYGDLVIGVNAGQTLTFASGGSYIYTTGAIHKITSLGSNLPTIISVAGGYTIYKDDPSTPSSAISVSMSVPGSAFSDDLVFALYNGTSWAERVRLTNAGYFGIGTDSPTNKLHIIDGAATQVRVGYDTSNYMTIAVGNTGQVQLDAVGSGSGFRFEDDITIADAKNIVLNTTTGTKIATGTSQKLGFYNVTPIAQRSGAAQAAVSTTGSTNVAPYGYTTAAQADAIVTLVNELRAWAVAQGFIKGSA